MRRSSSLIAPLVLFAACAGAPEETTAPLAVRDVIVTATPPADAQSFVAPASGDEEVPRATRGPGAPRSSM